MVDSLVPDAIRALRKLVLSAKSEQARAAAIAMVLDRRYGKPSQAVKHSGSVGTYDLTKVSDADLDRLEAILGPLTLAGPDTDGEETES